MEINSRIRTFLKWKRVTIQAFESSIGKTNGYIAHTKSPTAGVLADIARVYPEINLTWLITGDGNMLKTDQAESVHVSSGRDAIGNGISGDGNSVIAGSNMQNVGNSRHYDVPASGFLKIIYPDGREETIAGDSSLLELSNEIKLLKAENVHLKDNMAVKDELISSMKDVIAMLKHKQ